MSVLDRDEPRTEARVLGEGIGFRLCEETRRQEREPTPEERREDARREPYRHIWSIPVRYERVVTGRLVLQITDGQGLQRCWTDRSDRRVEQFLGSFVVGLLRAAEAIKRERAEAERRRKEQEERERRRQEEERRRWEEELRRREEEARFQKLDAEAAAWAKAARIRAYLAAVRAAQEARGGVVPGSELDGWLRWAEGRADALDPLTRPDAPSGR